jgi:hypothetical protein
MRVMENAASHTLLVNMAELPAETSVFLLFQNFLSVLI